MIASRLWVAVRGGDEVAQIGKQVKAFGAAGEIGPAAARQQFALRS